MSALFARLRHPFVILMAGLVMVGGGLLAVSTPAIAAGPTYSVMNTSEYTPDGVYFRNSPNWDDTSRVSGWGVYAGNRVQLQCWSRGTNVPRRDGGSNTIWYKANNVSRPTAPGGRTNQGWINAHFVNDGTGPGQVAPGVPPCDSSQPLPGGGSLYYSPYDGPDIKVYKNRWPFDSAYNWVSAPSPATVTLDQKVWQPGCNASNSVPQSPANKRITTLAGWSSGRNGPIMYLTARPSGWEAVNFILLIDPGNKDAYYNGGCDKAYPNKSAMLADWLARDKNHVLMVLAGEYTADYDHPVNGYAHAGIQNKLFPAIRDYPVISGRSIRSQAIVCNYDGVDHETMWMRFKGKMNDTNHTSCPGSPSSAPWHP